MSVQMTLLAPCGGCGGDVGPIHLCRTCFVHMHPPCGTPVGAKDFGQYVMCPGCEVKKHKLMLASPIVAALSRQNKSSQVSRLRSSKSKRDVVILSASCDESKSKSDEVPPQTNAEVEVTDIPTQPSSRAAQHVSTIQQRKTVISWMEDYMKTTGKKNMFTRGVDAFPHTFNSATRNANLNKAINWWKKRDQFIGAPRGAVGLSTRREAGRKRVSSKAVQGRGRRRSEWVIWIYPLLRSKFDRLRKLGLKFDSGLLRQLALRMMQQRDASKVDTKGVLLESKITTRWVRSIMENHNIVLRAQTGKRQLSPEKTAEIEKSVAVHLGELKRRFDSGKYDENAIENIDKTHFVIDFDNGKTLGFGGETQVKYADVVSGREGVTIVVRISGDPSGHIHRPMMIFTNPNRSHPIAGVADVEGVCYRSGPKGWMDKRIFRAYLCERKAQAPDRLGRKKTIFLDNCSGHLSEEEFKGELEALNASLQYLPPDATDLCQPAVSSVIAKIKDVWRSMWNLIYNNEWQNNPRGNSTGSRKLKNPGNGFFLDLAAKAVRRANAYRDKNNLNYARKAMIRCGLSLDVDGVWRVEQLYPHLQEIIKKYPGEFDKPSQKEGTPSKPSAAVISTSASSE